MKVKEILELTQTTNIAVIAKQIDGISEKPLRALLKEIGCEPNGSGKKGWRYSGTDETILEKGILELVPEKKTKPTAKKKQHASNDNIVYANNENNKLEIRKHSQDNINDDKIKDNTSDSEKGSEESNNMAKDVIANMLKGIEPEKPSKRFKGFYLDANVCDVIDRIKVGNKSEFVSMIIKTYLKENNLI